LPPLQTLPPGRRQSAVASGIPRDTAFFAQEKVPEGEKGSDLDALALHPALTA